ncbi:MAG: SDR family oxidoreductase [Nitratireductor sp.]
MIITGAAGGIGRETVRAMSAEGCEIICADISGSALDVLCSDLAGLPGKRVPVVSQLRDAAQCRSVVAAASGRVSGLVHLAGVFEPDPQSIDDMGVYDRAMAHNLTNGYLMGNAVAEAILGATGRKGDTSDGESEGYGAMVFTSSLAFLRGSWEHVPYAAAKGGLVGMTRAMSRRFAPHIRVNAIAPGSINTTMPAKLVAERGIERVTAEIPLRRMGEASEVASVIAFLMGAGASYVTGQCIHVDGGIINA